MNDPTLPLPGLSPVNGKRAEVRFDGGLMSLDGGVLALREIEKRFGVANRLAACLVDPRNGAKVTHSFTDIVRFRLLMIAAGYEDAIDANAPRSDPLFKMALDCDLCSQSTNSRLENLPDARALLGMGRAMVDLYCASFAVAPERITLDLDDTFNAVYGVQQLALFNTHYSEYGFQPMVVFDGQGRFVTAVLRLAKRASGKEIKPFLRRLLRAIRAHWPRVKILLLADSHYCAPEVLGFCRANGLDYIFGVAPTSTRRRHVETLEASTTARFETAPGLGKLRRFKEFYDGAQSGSRVERIIARVEVGADGPDTRFVVTNLTRRDARALYEDLYCRRGQAENHIKLSAEGKPMGWRSVIDGEILPVDPGQALREGRDHDLPMIVGWATHEADFIFQGVPRNADELESQLGPEGRRLFAAYGAERPGATERDIVDAVLTDWIFEMPCIAFAEARAKTGRRTFVYRMDWAAPTIPALARRMARKTLSCSTVGKPTAIAGTRPTPRRWRKPCSRPGSISRAMAAPERNGRPMRRRIETS